MKGPDWSKTAVFVVWDDWGGFYDHVPPPGNLGFRVPMLLVSPWARQGYTSSELHDHTSVLRWILDNFDAPPLPIYATTSANFDDAFDFSGDARRASMIAVSDVLPAPPIGTADQNAATLRLYLILLLAGVFVMAIGVLPSRSWRRFAPRAAPAPTDRTPRPNGDGS
jgi:hypothetical protein